MSIKFNPEVLPSMTLDELRDYQNPDKLRARIAELEAALQNALTVIKEYRLAFDDYGLFLGADHKRFDETINAALNSNVQ